MLWTGERSLSTRHCYQQRFPSIILDRVSCYVLLGEQYSLTNQIACGADLYEECASQVLRRHAKIPGTFSFATATLPGIA